MGGDHTLYFWHSDAQQPKAQSIKMNKAGFYLFFGIFALAGLICGAWGTYNLYTDYTIKNEGIKAIGTIVHLNSSGKGDTYAPVVEFRDELGYKVVYTASVYTNMVSYQIGQQVPLWYMTTDPEHEVYLEGMGWMGYFPFIFLFTHGGVGIGGLVWMEIKRRKINWLKNFGQAVKARYTGSKNVSGKRPAFKAKCEWNDPYTQTLYQFESERMSVNPDSFLSPNSQILVLIDPANPKRYWVDMAFLEQK